MRRLLIVEDEVRALVVLRKSFTRRGYVVKVATNAHDAIEVGRTFGPDVLLCDWLLQGKQTGLDVAEALRCANPELPVIFITGLPIPPLEAAAHHLQPCVFLAKPLRLHAIESAIIRALARPSRDDKPDKDVGHTEQS